MSLNSTGSGKNQIDWATHNWDPITGCDHGCPYCYAAHSSCKVFIKNNIFAGTNKFLADIKDYPADMVTP